LWLIRVALFRLFKGISIQIPMKVEAALKVGADGAPRRVCSADATPGWLRVVRIQRRPVHPHPRRGSFSGDPADPGE
jgi:hypothetical protein